MARSTRKADAGGRVNEQQRRQDSNFWSERRRARAPASPSPRDPDHGQRWSRAHRRSGEGAHGDGPKRHRRDADELRASLASSARAPRTRHGFSARSRWSELRGRRARRAAWQSRSTRRSRQTPPTPAVHGLTEETMGVNWKGLLGGIAPVLAEGAGEPGAGAAAAVGALSKALLGHEHATEPGSPRRSPGRRPSRSRRSRTPSREFSLKLIDNAVALERIEADDRSNARKRRSTRTTGLRARSRSRSWWRSSRCSR